MNGRLGRSPIRNLPQRSKAAAADIVLYAVTVVATSNDPLVLMTRRCRERIGGIIQGHMKVLSKKKETK